MALISFARGVPSPDLLPVDAIREAAARVLADSPAAVLSYGPGGGYGPLRERLAERHDVSPDHVVVTNGSLQGVAFVAELFVRTGRAHVVVEAPTYDRSLLNFRDRGYRIDPVPLEADGLDVNALAAVEPPALLYVIPTFQNPAGCTLSSAKRDLVVQWAAAHDVVVFEDDPYGLLRYAGEDIASLHDRIPERVIWSTSFTKTVAPGLRVGYLLLPDELLAQVTRIAVNTYISPSFLPQAIVADLLDTGVFDKGVATAKAALAERLDVMCAALDEHLPEASYVRPDGGYFLWLRLPAGVEAPVLAAAAARRDVAFVPGGDFFLEGGHDALRLAFSGVGPTQIVEGITRLAAALADLRG